MKHFLICLVLIPVLCVAAPRYHHPQEFIKNIKNDAHAGQKIYAHYCALCHDKSPQINLGAPRIGIKADWVQRQKQGINKMLANIDQGLGAMPPRGGCFECSDALLKAAIEYLIQGGKNPAHP